MRIMYFTHIKAHHFKTFYDYFYPAHEISVIGSHPAYKNFKGIDIFKIWGVGFFNKINHRLANIYTMLILKLIINLKKPDIIHIIGAYSSILKPLMNIKGRITPPIIVTPVGSDIHTSPQVNELIEEIVTKVLHRADIILIASKFFKSFIIERFKVHEQKCIVENWGLDIDKFDKIKNENKNDIIRKIKIKNDEIMILYPKGFRIKERQNYFMLLEAFKKLSQENMKTKLVMLSYGQKDNTKEVKEWIEKNKIQERITIIEEFLPNKEVIILLNIVDIMAIIPDMDLLSGVILEGMLCGTIPILSNIGPYTCYFENGKNCYYVNQKDSDSIKNVLEYCVKNRKEIKKRFEKFNPKFVKEHFDKNKQMPKIEKIYYQVIKNK